MKLVNLVLPGAALTVALGAVFVMEYDWSVLGQVGNPQHGSIGAPDLIDGGNSVDKALVALKEKTPDEELLRGTATGESTEVAALRQEVRELRAAVNDLLRQSQQQSLVTATLNEDSSPEEPIADPLEEEQWLLEQMLAQESTFQQEPLDESWSSHSTRQIENAFNELAVEGAAVSGIECRASTCRVEIAVDEGLKGDGAGPRNSIEKSLPLLTMKLAESLPNMTAFQTENGGARGSTVLYFSNTTD